MPVTSIRNSYGYLDVPDWLCSIPFTQTTLNLQNYKPMTREIKIVPVLNGWICDVGCQRVVFDNLDDMIQELRAYYQKPKEVELKYLGNAVNQVLRPEMVPIQDPHGLVAYPAPPSAQQYDPNLLNRVMSQRERALGEAKECRPRTATECSHASCEGAPPEQSP